ncbi:hypothetical protein V9T40_002346 [Parthenolecanium corni]|uniref:Carboxylic ester hydrolase n=1 Tax=Parthenolecanium corni TaxID=536013 RepID=A0AAN9Y5I4_9HEMI
MNTIIEVKQGQLEGTTRKSISTGKDYFCYLGIPYAKPPIGELRFQPPQPIEKWNGVLNAQNEGSACIQQDFGGPFIGSEDCLYLNVYTPDQPTKNSSPKAVMVFIHGGAFNAGSGSSDLYSADYLMNYDVILVTLNYRVHALGFLDMGTKNCTGNCGLRDQMQAMKWVKENIKQFGGDPENITIFGESAGATSVYLQVLSPMSKGLFNKAIIQSDFGNTYYGSKRNLPKLGFKLGEKLGFNEKDPEKLVEFLKKQPADEICKQAMAVLADISKDTINLNDTFGPSPEIIKENAFLPDTYQNLRKNAAPIPLIVGFNNKEGRIMCRRLNLIETLRNDFTSVILNPAQYNSQQLKDMSDKIKKYYLDDKPVNEESVERIVDLYTDYCMRDFYDCIDFMSTSNVAVYIYEFSFFGKFNLFEKLFNLKNIPAPKSGAGHADELPYLFYPKKLMPKQIELTEPEVGVIRNMCSLWTSFAKSSNPTANLPGIEWKPFKPEKPYFLSINKDLKLTEEKLRGKEFEFWQKLLQ